MPCILRVLSRLPPPWWMAVNMVLRREDSGLVCRLRMHVKDPRFLMVDPDDGVRHDLILSAKPIVELRFTNYFWYPSTTEGGRTLASFGFWPNSRRASRCRSKSQHWIEFDLDRFQAHLIVIGQVALPIEMLL